VGFFFPPLFEVWPSPEIDLPEHIDPVMGKALTFWFKTFFLAQKVMPS